MITISRRETFNAAHRLFREEWSDEKNLEIFGKCSNPNWHGHNYILFVTVKGEPDPVKGYVINMNILKKIVQEKIILKVDHKNLNLDVDFMNGQVATTENLAVAIWNELSGPVEAAGARLHCIRIEETENNSIEYYGKED